MPPPLALTRISHHLSPRHGQNEPPNIETIDTVPNAEIHPLQSPQHQLSLSSAAPPNLESVEPKPSSSNLTKLLQIHAYLIIFSILGTLVRLGLVGLTSYRSSPLTGVIWANFAGCAMMGILVSDARVFGPGKVSLPLYTGLTTGLCGSITSFSSFSLDAFKQMAMVPHGTGAGGRGNDFLALAEYVIATLTLSLGGLQLGAHAASAMKKGAWNVPLAVFRVVDIMLLTAAPAFWIIPVVLAAAWPHWRDITFALVFAPVGAMMRFWISRVLNPKVRAFPVGTLMCNIYGSLVLAGMAVGLEAGYRGVGCSVMHGIADGFCGCLSTVSTFVVELRGLKLRAAYTYGSASVAAGVSSIVVVYGSWVWTKGAGGRDGVC